LLFLVAVERFAAGLGLRFLGWSDPSFFFAVVFFAVMVVTVFFALALSSLIRVSSVLPQFLYFFEFLLLFSQLFLTLHFSLSLFLFSELLFLALLDGSIHVHDLTILGKTFRVFSSLLGNLLIEGFSVLFD
jgi:hypothetical protein